MNNILIYYEIKKLAPEWFANTWLGLTAILVVRLYNIIIIVYNKLLFLQL